MNPNLGRGTRPRRKGYWNIKGKKVRVTRKKFLGLEQEFQDRSFPWRKKAQSGNSWSKEMEMQEEDEQMKARTW